MKSGERILISAGPTREYWDPVRYLSNGSSGKMGFALAAAARDRGLLVDLVTGPVALPDLPGVTMTRVVSALEMESALRERWGQSRMLIMCAAVCDYRPVTRWTEKQSSRKDGSCLVLELEANPDIVAGLARSKQPGQILVGFAAETHDLEHKAREKMERKQLDWIVANDVSQPGIGMEAEDNAAVLYGRNGGVWSFGRQPKPALAEALLEVLCS